MPRTEVRPERDWAADPSGVRDSTLALRRAAQDAARNHLPLDLQAGTRFRFDTPVGPAFRTGFVIDADSVPAGTGTGTLVLAPNQAIGAPGSEAAAVVVVGGLGFELCGWVLDMQAAQQTPYRPNGSQGFVCHGVRLQGSSDPSVDVTVLNPLGTTALSIPGVQAETFAFQDLGGDRGTYRVIVAAHDGGESATGIVFQMRLPSAAPWVLTEFLAAGLKHGQGLGCFSGGSGVIQKGLSYRCGLAGLNFEAGPYGTPSMSVGGLPAPGWVASFAASPVQVVECGAGVVVNGNGASGAPQVDRVVLAALGVARCDRGVHQVGLPTVRTALQHSWFEDTNPVLDLGGGTLAKSRIAATTVASCRTHSTTGAKATRYTGMAGKSAPSAWDLQVV